MFGLFKSDPEKKLRKKYEKLMAEATELQRSGDIKGYARKSDEAEAVMRQLQELKK